jgi:endonuclease YncB( thermonuclease family)
MRAVTTRRGWALPLATLLLLSSCIGQPLPHERRYSKKKAQEQLAAFEQPGLVIGEFTLAPDPVIDGDTIKVEGLKTSLRLLGIDAEETFKSEEDRRAFEAGWEKYQKDKRGDGSRPVKYATPVGEDGKTWAKAFFGEVSTVRLERDHAKEIRDFYNRYLAYAIIEKDGQELNFNVECVRAGFSPYFTKYGQSRRFHAEFVAAEKEAREAKRGIWDAEKMHYPDYDERKVWWDSRGAFIDAFEDDAEGKENWITLTHWDSLKRLQAHQGQEVVVLGSISEIQLGDKGPTKVMLSRRMGSSFPLIFFDKDAFLSSGIARFHGEYIRAQGQVTEYKNPHTGKVQLQLVIDLPSQITGPASKEN